MSDGFLLLIGYRGYEAREPVLHDKLAIRTLTRRASFSEESKSLAPHRKISRKLAHEFNEALMGRAR